MRRWPVNSLTAGDAAWGAAPGRRRRAPAAGLTLVEMVLAMGLVVLVAAVGVINFTGWGEARKLPEGALRFETVLRMARADAANLGRCIRLSVNEDMTELCILWEADPLGQPQQFTPYDRCTWLHHCPTGLVRLGYCRLTGPGARWTVMNASRRDGGAQTQESSFEPVTFYPDGSSDSAVFELRSMSPSDSRRAVIELDGFNGTITTRIVSSAEYEEYAEESGDSRPPEG